MTSPEPTREWIKPSRVSLKARFRAVIVSCLIAPFMLGAIAACKKSPSGATGTGESSPAPPATPDSAVIVQRFRDANSTLDSTAKISARIIEETGATREIRLTISRKSEPDGGEVMLIEFTSPVEERDRSSLITITPKGDIEATRYAQSTNSFVAAKGATSEDSLFGLSLQELAEGQIEKYDLAVLGEENFNSQPVYRLEGTLKQGADSKFHRIILLVSKETFKALVAEFYDRQGTLVRQMEAGKFETINGRVSRTQWVVDNVAHKRKIEFQTQSVTYDPKLSESLFSRESLKKITAK